MRCASCYTDNVNEAKYCRNCGRNIRESRLKETKGKGITFTAVVVCLGIVIAAVVICSRLSGKLLAKASVSAESFGIPATESLVYAEKDGSITIWYSDNEEEKTNTFDAVGEVKSVTEGYNCAVVKTSSGSYFVSKSTCEKMDGCVKYVMSGRSATAVFINAKGELYKCSDSGISLVSDNVMDFTLSDDGDAYYLKETTKKSETEETTYKENTFYMDAKYVCTEDPDDKCDRILCANGFGLFYVTNSGKLYAVDKTKDKENKYELEGFSGLIAVGKESILITKNDDKTYVWDGSNEETELTDIRVCEMIVPEGYEFSGDKYTEIMYGADENGDGISDCAVYVYDDGTRSEAIGQGGMSFAVSGDCSLLYCVNSDDELWRYDSTGRHNPEKCGENVSEYIVSPDGKKVWYVSDNKLYLFNGLSSEELCDITGWQEMSATRFGTIVLRIKKTEKIQTESGKEKQRTVNSLCIYRNGLETVVENIKNTVFCGKARCDWCYVDNDGLHKAQEDGTFRTASELKAEDENASDSANAG